MKMSVVYMSFIGIIVLIVRESACEWQRNSDNGRRSIYNIGFIVIRDAYPTHRVDNIKSQSTR